MRPLLIRHVAMLQRGNNFAEPAVETSIVSASAGVVSRMDGARRKLIFLSLDKWMRSRRGS